MAFRQWTSSSSEHTVISECRTSEKHHTLGLAAVSLSLLSNAIYLHYHMLRAGSQVVVANICELLLTTLFGVGKCVASKV